MLLQNTLRLSCFLPLVLFVLKYQTSAVSAAEQKSPVFREINESLVSDEFDRPRLGDNFKTLAPEGPSTNTLNKATVTSMLVSPNVHDRISTADTKYRVARPGSKSRRPVFRNKERSEDRHSLHLGDFQQLVRNPLKTCQYIFTVENAADCTHTTTEIAVNQVANVDTTETQTLLNEYSERLRNLEKAVYGSPSEPQSVPIQMDSAEIVHVQVHSTDSVLDPNASSSVSTGQEHLSSLTEIAQEMIKQLSTLERGIVRSEQKREDLQSHNENLILTLRRSSTAKRNLVSLKSDLERSLRRLREENVKLCASNRTLTMENAALRYYKANVESAQESLRKRVRLLEAEKMQNIRETGGCRHNNIRLLNEKNILKRRVGNLTDIVEKCKKISTEDESLQYELEREREKNEILALNNSQIQKALENATLRIKQLINEKEMAVFSAEEGSIATEWTPGHRPNNDQDYAHCGKISAISNPETIRGSQSYLEKSGVWMMDPLQAMGESKVWSIDTTKERIKELKQYENLRKFILNQPEDVTTLIIPVESTGAVIYNGSLYYQRRNSRKLVRYDLQTKRIIRERPVHHAGFHGVFAYHWGGHTDIDLAVDELGLWVIYSTRQNEGNIVISKLNPTSLRTIATMKTSIPKRSVANAFMVCGILYTVDSYDSPKASLNYEFDTFRRKQKRISIPFANQHRYNVMIDYNPQSREIYSWDNSHQVKYYVTLDKSLGSIAKLLETRRYRRSRRS